MMKVTWRSPANLALIKYWGKKENQFPINPSLSFPLLNCLTQTSVEALEKATGDFDLKCYLNNELHLEFTQKIKKYFQIIAEIEPRIKNYHYKVMTQNSFPHGAGIASSASGYSALAGCLGSLFQQSDIKTLSHWARLGSGSACRSFYDEFSIWGESAMNPSWRDEHASSYPMERVHPLFQKMHNLIFLVDTHEKKVSSSEGHALMQSSHFKEARIIQAQLNLKKILSSLEIGDWESFQRIVEEEALTLHGLMLAHEKGYSLTNDKTWGVIHFIRELQKNKKNQICFTLDAGPNVHVLFPQNQSSLKAILHSFAEENKISCIESGWGTGARQL